MWHCKDSTVRWLVCLCIDKPRITWFLSWIELKYRTQVESYRNKFWITNNVFMCISIHYIEYWYEFHTNLFCYLGNYSLLTVHILHRQMHKSFFEKSDLFFLCMLRPLSFDIQKQEQEIEAAKVIFGYLIKPSSFAFPFPFLIVLIFIICMSFNLCKYANAA